MNITQAKQIFEELGIEINIENVKSSFIDFINARQSFTEEEYSTEEHAQRTEAVFILLNYLTKSSEVARKVQILN